MSGVYSLSTMVEITTIYKSRNTGTGNGMRGMQGTRGMFTMIPGNLLEDSWECSHISITGNAREDSGECSRRFEDYGSVQEDTMECSRKLRGMLSILN